MLSRGLLLYMKMGMTHEQKNDHDDLQAQSVQK